MWKFFSSLSVCLFITLSAAAQQADTVKTKRSFIPTNLRVGTDLFSIARSSYDKTFTGWELNADLDLDRYFLVVDYGYWARDLSGDTEQYTSSGTYFRVGADANFLKNDPDQNVFLFGIRYARSVFTETLVIEREDPVWGVITANAANNNITGNWIEFVSGLRVKIYKMIWMGYTVRLKFGLNTNETGNLLPHDVPGYGPITNKGSYWGFNYQVFVRIPVRKQR